MTSRNGKLSNLACAGGERCGLQRLNLTNFAERNSINTGYYYVLFFLAEIICVHHSAELDSYHNCGTLRDCPEAWLLRKEQPCIAT